MYLFLAEILFMPFYFKDAGIFVIIGDAPLNFALWQFLFLTLLTIAIPREKTRHSHHSFIPLMKLQPKGALYEKVLDKSIPVSRFCSKIAGL